MFSFDVFFVCVWDYVEILDFKESICVFVGVMVKGVDNFVDLFVDEKIFISNFFLFVSVVCSKFCYVVEDVWDIMWV